MKKMIKFIFLFLLFSNIIAFSQWKSIGPPTTINCINRFDDRILVSVEGGVYYTDYTENFKKSKSDVFNSNDVFCFCNLDSAILVGTSKGIYTSKDIGENWIKLENELKNSEIYSLAYSNNSIYAGTKYKGAYVSKDYGKTWQKYDVDKTDIYITGICADKDSIFISTYNGFYSSSNNGMNWKKVNAGLTDSSISSICTFGNRIFVTTQYGGIFAKSYSDTVWVAKNNGLLGMNFPCIANGGKYLIAGANSKGVFLSEDLGENWKRISELNAKYLISAICAFDSNIIVGTQDVGLVKTSNLGLKWEPFNQGISNSNVQSVNAIDNKIITTTGRKTVSIFNENENKWHSSYWQSYGVFSKIYRYKNRLYSGISYQGIAISNDEGESWSSINSDTTQDADLNCLYGIGDSLIICTTTRGIFIGPLEGGNWISRNKGMGKTSIASMCGTGNYLFAGAYGAGVFVSSDNGLNWSPVNSGLLDLNVFNLYQFKDKLFASTKTGLFTSTYYGETWTLCQSTNLTDIVNPLTASGGLLFAGTNNSGVFYSNDLGVSWFPLNEGLANLSINDLCSDSSRILAATAGGGICIFDFPNKITPPILISPEDKLQQASVSPVFIWRVSTPLAASKIQVSYDSLFNTITFEKTLQDTMTKTIDLAENTKYYWRVQNHFGDIFSEWSKVNSFTTGVKSSIDYENARIPSVYPNPAYNELFINVPFSNTELIKISISNSLGQTIFKSDKIIQSGKTSIDISKFVQGTYYLQIELDSQLFFKQFVVIQ